MGKMLDCIGRDSHELQRAHIGICMHQGLWLLLSTSSSGANHECWWGGESCASTNIFFVQPKILKEFLFLEGFLCGFGIQATASGCLSWSLSLPPKLASFTFSKFGLFHLGHVGVGYPCGFRFLRRFLVRIRSCRTRWLHVVFCTISEDISQFYSLVLKNITCNIFCSFFENHLTGFPIWFFVGCFVYPITFWGRKTHDHRLHSSRSLQLLSQVGAVYCDVVSSTGPEARWAQSSGDCPMAPNSMVLVLESQGSLGHENFILSCKTIFVIFSSIQDFIQHTMC